MHALVGKVWQKQTANEARAHGSAKISGKALGVQYKMGSKEFKNRSIEPWRGHNETHGGGLKYQSPIAKPTHHRHRGGLAQHGSSAANCTAGLGLAHWRGG